MAVPAGRSPAQSSIPWHLYVVECRDQTLYVGIAKDVDSRLDAHNAGRGARYTRTRRPVRLVYRETCPDQREAMRRERKIKRWSRPKKVAELGLESPAKLGRARTCGQRSRPDRAGTCGQRSRPDRAARAYSAEAAASAAKAGSFSEGRRCA